MLAPVVTIAGLTAATAALQVRDPHVSGSWGLCPSLALFGVACPACGGLRAVNDLTNADLVAAASSNLLFVVSIPLVLFLLCRWTFDSWCGHARRSTWLSSSPVLAVGFVLVAIFSVARNLNGSWLAP
jgi:hypothetical protein